MDLTGRVLCGLVVEESGEPEAGIGIKARRRTDGAARAIHVFAAPVEPLEPQQVDRFLADLGRLACLDSPHLERVEGPFREGDLQFYTTRWTGHPSLEDLLARGGPIAPERALVISAQLCAALRDLHAVGVVFGQLRPSNVLMGPGDRVAVTGFAPQASLAQAVAWAGHELRWEAGRLPYLGPERFRGAGPSRQGDLYALGVILYRMLTGRLPFPAREFLPFADQVVEAQFRSPSRVNVAVPPSFDRLVRWLMSADPLRRPLADAAWRRHDELRAHWATVAAPPRDEIPPQKPLGRTPADLGLEATPELGVEIPVVGPPNPRANPLYDSLLDGPVPRARPRYGSDRGISQRHPLGESPSPGQEEDSTLGESASRVAVALMLVIPILLAIVFSKMPDRPTPNKAIHSPATILTPPLPRPVEPTVVELPDRLDQSSDKFEDLCLLGKLPAAEAKTKQLVALARHQSGDNLAGSLRELNRQVKLYIAVGDLSRARTFCDEAEALCRPAFGDRDPLFAVCRGNRGELHLAARSLPEAEVALVSAAEMLRRDPEESGWDEADRVDFAQILADLAELHTRKGDLARAVGAHDEAMRVLRGHVNDEDLQLMAVRNSLADLYRAIGDFTKAEPLLTESHAITGRTAQIAVQTIQKDVVREVPRVDPMAYYNSSERAMRQSMGIIGGDPFGPRSSRGGVTGRSMSPGMRVPGSVDDIVARNRGMLGLNPLRRRSDPFAAMRGPGSVDGFMGRRSGPFGGDPFGGDPFGTTRRGSRSFAGSSPFGPGPMGLKPVGGLGRSFDPFGGMRTPGGIDDIMAEQRDRMFGHLPPEVRRMVDPSYDEEDEEDEEDDDPTAGPFARGYDPMRRMGFPGVRTGQDVMAELNEQLYGHLPPSIRSVVDPEGYQRQARRTRRARSERDPFGLSSRDQPASTTTYVQRLMQRLLKPPPLAACLAHLSTINRMAELYLAKGDLAAADKVLADGQTFVSRLKLDDAALPALRVLLFNQGRCHALKGDVKKAREWFARAVARGDERGLLAALVAKSEALLDLQAGDARHAVARLRALVERDLKEAQFILPGLSEAEALGFVEANLQDRHVLLQALREISGPTAREAYEWVWRTRALATRAIAEQRRWAVDGGGAAEPLLKELRAVTQEFSALAHAAAPEDTAQRQERGKRLAQLNESKEALEKKLAGVSRPFRRDQGLQSAQVADLVAGLPEGTAVVDFVQSRVDRPGDLIAGLPRPTPHYDAFIIRGGTETGEAVTWVRLGPAGPIDRAVADWRSALAARVAPVSGSEDPSVRLRRLIWDPIERTIGGCRTVIIIPDQALTRVPWPALPGPEAEPGTYLLDRYAIATAPYGQGVFEVLARSREAADEPRLLLLGGADYDRSPSEPAGGGVNPMARAHGIRGPSRSPEARTRSGWAALAGTLEEVHALKRLWRRSGSLTLLTGAQANERELRRAMPRSQYIHLATHGFFADPAFRSALQNDLTAERLFGALGEAGGDASFGRATVAGRNPLILSGIVLSGANQPPRTDDQGRPTGDDGILTAEEVAYLDLADTELVVLSACQTGLGDVAGGEGVFGLQRAFHLAGARTTVASLWQVDDQATQALMVEFYRNLWERRLSRIEALRQAQLMMLEQDDPARRRLERGREVERPGAPLPSVLPVPTPSRRLSPFYWAAFTLSGDWR